MIPQAIFNQVERMLRPLRTKVSNLVARAVIQSIKDSGTRQTAQVGGLDKETLGGIEHFIPYGLISVPSPGAEGVMLFVDGDRGHPLLFAVDDRAARPKGGDPGDTGLYHFDGAQIRLNKDGEIVISAKDGAEIQLQADGNITISAKPGGKVFVNDGSGTTRALALSRELKDLRDWVEAQFSASAGHVHTVVMALTTSMVTVAPPAAPPPTPSIPPTAIGTTVLEGK